MKELKTIWTDEVLAHPDKVLQEYPRPMMARDSYINLNGYWDYAITNEPKKPKQFNGKILVPFSPEAPLSGVNRILQPGEFLWYRRYLPAGIYSGMSEGHRILLHFGAVDQYAVVFVNGYCVGSHLGGYLPFTVDITEALRQFSTIAFHNRKTASTEASGHESPDELLIVVQDATDKSYHSRGKQKLEHGGMFYTPQSGIWQTVWMEQVPENYIEDVKITPDYDKQEFQIEVRKHAATPLGVKVCVTTEDAGHKKSFTRFISPEEPWNRANDGLEDELGTITIPVPEFHPWSPEDPFLYRITIGLGADRVECYGAMRKIEAKPDENGIQRIFLNDKPCFQAGVLDQGYWPDGLYTAPTDEALIFDIKAMKELGFNMIRKHIKIEPQRWYYHCDRLGMLVWQDMVCGGRPYKSWHVTYLANVLSPLGITHRDTLHRLFGREEDEGRKEFINETKETIKILFNHPSIVTWTIFNEGWGQFDAKKVYEEIKDEDTTRLFDMTSGWFDQGVGDFKSIHNYFVPLRLPEKPGHTEAATRVIALTEFGGLTYRVPDHSMCQEEYGYKTFESKEALMEGYENLLKRDIYPNVPKGLCVSIYTQVSDVEEEINGIYTYDRKVLKFDKERMKKRTPV